MRIYGINPVKEAFRAGLRPDKVYVISKKSSPDLNAIRKQAREAGVTIEERKDFNALFRHGAHQGVAADVATEQLHLPFNAPFSNGPMVMLDGIEDPHNFGAALRVCECFGIREIIYQKDNSCGLTPTSVKVSTGAVFHVGLRLNRLNNVVKRLKEENIPLVILDNGSEQSIYNVELPERYCLVIGSEGKGVRNTLKRQADYQLEIPMSGKVNSLNVSCALSAALSQLCKPV